MKQTAKFINPVYKAGGNNLLIEVGDTLELILRDGSPTDVTVTAVSDDGRSVSWDHATESVRYGDVRAVSSAHVKSCAQYGGAYDPEGTDPILV